jgi:hypothetical protein
MRKCMRSGKVGEEHELSDREAAANATDIDRRRLGAAEGLTRSMLGRVPPGRTLSQYGRDPDHASVRSEDPVRDTKGEHRSRHTSPHEVGAMAFQLVHAHFAHVSAPTNTPWV